MFLELLYRLSIVVVTLCLYLVKVEGAKNNLLSVSNPNIQVAIGESVDLIWNIAIQQNENKNIVCIMKYRHETRTLLVAKGEYDVDDKHYVFDIPLMTRLNFKRLQYTLTKTSSIENEFKLTIKNVSYVDNNTFSCALGQEVSSLDLFVYRPVTVSIPVKPVATLSGLNDTATLTTTLCGKPKPKVTMEHYSVIENIAGEPTDSNECYTYTFSDLSLKAQTDCGQEIKLTYTDVGHTIQRKVKMTIALLPTAPKSAEILLTGSNCARIRWDGPNIGSCVEPTLSYDVVVSESDSVLKIFETSSNTVEVCGIDMTSKTVVTKIRCRISGVNSTWTQAEIVLYTGLNDSMRTVIIACSVLFVFIFIVMIVYCCYVNKCKLKCLCCKKILKRSQKQGENLELITVPAQKTPEITHRKASRNMSVDGTLSAIDTSVLLGDLNAKNRLDTPDDELGNHNTRFHSLQRNIERERKKQEEEQKQHDEFFMPRRNTDSYLLRDIHPSYDPPDPPSSYDQDATSSTPKSPVYDILPQTRTSNSTNSTGHDDDEYSFLPRRNTDTEILNGSSRNNPNNEHLDPVRLYDFLPPSSTRSSRQSEQSEHSSIYDAVPTGRTAYPQQQNENDAKSPPAPPLHSKLSKQNDTEYDLVPIRNRNLNTPNVDDQNNVKETIYDVPTKHSELNYTDDDYTPFTSHRGRGANKYSSP